MKSDFGSPLRDSWITRGSREFEIGTDCQILIAALQSRFPQQKVEQHRFGQLLVGQIGLSSLAFFRWLAGTGLYIGLGRDLRAGSEKSQQQQCARNF